MVVHKTTGYSPEEIQGFLSAIGQRAYDLVSFHQDDPIRFLRYGDWPVLRGTLETLAKAEYVLYTSGYVPRVRVYPGVRVPTPFTCGTKVQAQSVSLPRRFWVSPS